jgi:hypothetical protein
MLDMHSRKSLVSIISASTLIFTVLVSCSSVPNLTAEEIITKSREHFASTTSFEATATHYFNPNLDEPSTVDRLWVEPPSNFAHLDQDGSPRVMAINDTVYRRSEMHAGKWSRSIAEGAIGNSNEKNLLVGFFPPRMFEIEFADSDDDHYTIEGYGERYNNLGIASGSGSWHRLKIRRSDFALVESTRFDYPSVSIDENGEFDHEIPQPTDPDGSTPFAHMRTVTTVSRYNEDLGIDPPSESDIIVELVRTWPKDGEGNIQDRGIIGFLLSEPVEIMDLSLSPPTALEITEINHPTLNEFPGVRFFKPTDSWERDTTYIATLTWGDSTGDVETISWTFSTR